MSFFLNLIGLGSRTGPSAEEPKTEAAPPAPAQEAAPESALPGLGTSEIPTAYAEVTDAREIHGAVDGFQPPGTFSGWAVDYTNAGNPLDIRILLDGQQIGAGVTSFHRSDIRTEVANTAGFRIGVNRAIDPELIVRGNIEILADGRPLYVWEVLTARLKAASQQS